MEKDNITPISAADTEEKVTRRGLFRFGIKIGAGLLAFIPAVSVLLKNIPNAEAAADIPNYYPCTRGFTYVLADATDQCANTQYFWALFDSQTGQFCCCSDCKTSCCK